MKTNTQSLKDGDGDQGERDSTEIYIRIDTNTNSPNYYDDKEVESKSNKRIYHN